MTDETQLTQVFQNLVGNAIKYRGAELPLVHISATKTADNEWIFSVRDNGLGIDPQYFERIFILFQRLHGRKSSRAPGIGLAICKKMVERMGGRIWVESQPGRVQPFTSLCRKRIANDEIDWDGCDTLEVLLVEDSPGDVRLTREAFKDAKVHINLHVASDGAEAMAFLNARRESTPSSSPDLILLDLNLPRKDGREVLEEIKENPALKSIPVVILTTSASEEDILRSYLLHANCYITKPVDLDGFLKVVKSHRQLLAVRRQVAARSSIHEKRRSSSSGRG